MCQAIAEGGRRCPIHRRETILAVNIAERDTGLNQAQLGNLFTELRREGRHTLFNDDGYWHAYLDSLAIRSPDTETRQEVFAARDEAETPDTATMYALRRLHSRAEERARNLTGYLQTVADSKGWSLEETKEKFDDYHASTKLSRTGAPEGYTVSAVRTARAHNLPQDKQSIVALHKLSSEEVETEKELRIARQQLAYPTTISEAGYDDGRLEVVFAAAPDTVYTYQNVPESTWEALKTTQSPGRVYNQLVRGRRDYAYASQEEADADAYRVRCSGCGQFIARTGGHECPDRVEEDDSKVSTVGKAEEPVASAKTEVAEEAEAEPAVGVENTTETPGEESTDSTVNESAVEAQRNPQVMEMPAPEHKFSTYTDGYYLEQLSSSSWLARYENKLSEEELERIKDAHKDSTFLVRVKLDEEDNVVYKTTESGRTIPQYEIIFENKEGEYFLHSDYRTRKILVYPARKRTEDELSTREERIAAGDAEAAEREKLIESGEAVEVDAAASATRTYRVDGNRPEAPAIAWARVRDFRRAINDGKIVSSSLVWKFNRPRSSTSLPLCDDQGYAYPSGGYDSGEVYGTLSMRRKEDGTMELVKSKRSLRCNCYDYRRHYRCEHVDYVVRHAPNLGQQMMEPAGGASGTRRPPAPRVSTALGDLPASIANRPDFSVMTGTEARPTYIAFSGGNYRVRRASLLESVPTGIDTSTEEGKKAMYRARMTMGSYVTAPPASIINRALRYGPVETDVNISYGGDGYGGSSVAGSVTLERQEDGTVRVKHRRLRCYCYDYRNNYDCMHIRIAENSHIVNALTNTSRPDEEAEGEFLAEYRSFNYGMSTEERRNLKDAVYFNTSLDQAESAREAYNQNLAEERERRAEQERQAQREAAAQRAAIKAAKYKEVVRTYEAYHARIKENWDNREPGYTENPESFENDYRAALSAKRKGESPIEFRTENVLDGMASGEGARGFGVELEFEIKSGVNRNEALRKIGMDLHAAGLTASSRQERYHAAENQAGGAYSSWSFEQDATVDGELVSPILRDTPEHWNQLKTAVEIIKKHGGEATSAAGSHVHVSSGSYMDSTAKHAELLRTVRANEDTLYRVASNPAVGRHRGTQWCRPNGIENNSAEVISKEVKEGHNVLGWNAHGRALNLTGSAQDDPSKSHVEFRTWDATLDPAVIQQQIAYSVAVVDRADRSVEEKGSSSPVAQVRELGSHQRTSALNADEERNLKGYDFQQRNGHVAEFIDSLFRRKEDRKNATALFAITNWQR